MSGPYGFKIADWGEPEDICNTAGNSLYKTAELCWSNPKPWKKGAPAPVEDTDGPCLYAIIRNHGNAAHKDWIEYIGLSMTPSTRFVFHPTAHALVAKRGQVTLSTAPVNFIRGRNRIRSQKRALEELEHLLIWALGPPKNIRKNYTLPGMGTHRGNAWHVINRGYPFAGQMPLEIVFPWMLLRPGRDRSRKAD